MDEKKRELFGLCMSIADKTPDYGVTDRDINILLSFAETDGLVDEMIERIKTDPSVSFEDLTFMLHDD